MAKWKKPFRSTARWLRQRRLGPQEPAHLRLPNWVKIISKDALVALLLSIVPGLAQIVQKRFRQVRWHCAAWLALVLTGLFFYGSPLGLFLFGLAIGLHTWIAIHQLVKELDRFRWRVLVAVFVVVALALIYRAVPGWLLPDIVSGYTSLAVPYHNVQPGDYLLARRSTARREFIRRGSLVLVPLERLHFARGRAGPVRGANAATVQVIALPGEMLEIENGVFVVDGRQLDAEKYPIPEWLRQRKLSVNIGHDRCFVSAEYHVYAHGRQLTNADIIHACVIQQSDIEAQVFMRWLPLSRRGFIKAIE